ncbi:MAG TPA: coenzyme F420-0:L-glutamate ligase, partial [Pyrinomonadaceae bacterium]|nr:coenzyme F420-0:L-glutamate ligase [Pyrinomonadaceae bacterium]
VVPGDDVGELIARALEAQGLRLADGDVVVVAQKIVSKAEGRLRDLASVSPSAAAVELAARQGRDPRLVEVILGESARVVRASDRALIAETRHGFVCANAGVDCSNVGGEGRVALLPLDPDLSARRIRARLAGPRGAEVAVIVTDTFGRAWRLGLTNAAIGVAGMMPLQDYRGQTDDFGRELSATVLAVADEMAAASGLLMRKAERVPAVVVRGGRYERASQAGSDMLLRPRELDLFR